MGNVENEIRVRLAEKFLDAEISVTDDSSKHAGHAGAKPGGETHFSVRIISDAFQGMGRVARHRAVYGTLQPLFDAGLHALAINALTPDEA
jgi:BolA protein